MPRLVLEFVDNSSITLTQYINKCVDNIKDVMFRKARRVDKLDYVIEQYNNENPLHVEAYTELSVSRQFETGHDKNKALVLHGYIDSKVFCCIYLDLNGFI